MPFASESSFGLWLWLWSAYTALPTTIRRRPQTLRVQRPPATRAHKAPAARASPPCIRFARTRLALFAGGAVLASHVDNLMQQHAMHTCKDIVKQKHPSLMWQVAACVEAQTFLHINCVLFTLTFTCTVKCYKL